MTGVFKDGAYYPLGSVEEMSEGEYEAYAQDAHDFDYDGSERLIWSLKDFLDGLFPSEWSTRDARAFKIAEMTTSHLDNAIRYFERAGLGEHPKIVELREERKRR